MRKILSNNLYIYTKTEFLELGSELRNKKDFVIQCLQKNADIYDCLSPELQADEEIIINAFSQDSEIYSLIPEEFKNNHQFLMDLVNIDPLILDKFNHKFRNEKNIILIAIGKIGVDALWHKNIEVYKDLEIMISAKKSRYGQNMWDPVLNSCGDDAIFAKKIIDVAYSIYGDSLLQHDFNWILNQKEIREIYDSN